VLEDGEHDVVANQTFRVLKKPRFRMMTWRSSAVSLFDFQSSMSFCIGTSVGIQ